MKNLNIVVAVGKKLEIGKDNKIIWRFKRDNQFFRKIIKDSYIIMGTNTYNSIPKNLESKGYIILSRNSSFEDKNVQVFRSLNESLEYINNSEESFYVIGGSEIYKLYLDYVDTTYMTEIEASCPTADAYFQRFNHNEWEQTVLEKNQENGIEYSIVKYMRK